MAVRAGRPNAAHRTFPAPTVGAPFAGWFAGATRSGQIVSVGKSVALVRETHNTVIQIPVKLLRPTRGNERVWRAVA